MPGDYKIARRIRQGDKKQFESLFRSFYVSLVRYAVTMIKDQDTAEEIVQDLFFRLWKDKEKLQIKSSLNGYLFRAVHNRCLHHISHSKVVEKHARETLVLGSTVDEDTANLVNFNDLQEKVAGILERLPPRCGQIFCMNRFEGLKYSEIAERLAISVKTVEANMGRALKEFRKALTEQ